MGKYCADKIVKNQIATNKAVNGGKVAILCLTFKCNCPHTRNAKIIDIVHNLNEYGITPVITDAEADTADAKQLQGIELVDMNTIKEMDAVVLAIAYPE